VLKQERDAHAQRGIVDEFGKSLPDCSLLCFFDDEDCQEFKRIMGAQNREFHRPIGDSTPFAGWPDFLIACIFIDDPASFLYSGWLELVPRSFPWRFNQQLPETQFLRIKDDLDGFGVTAMVAVSRVPHIAAAVAHTRRNDAGVAADQILHSPETSAG